VRLREATPADFPRLLEIDRVCFPPGIASSAGELREGMHGPHAFTLVAEAVLSEAAITSMIAGFLVGRPEVGGRGHIITIDVLPEFQRMRVGKSMMDEAERRFRQLKLHAVTLEAAVNNTAALAFYRQLGYKRMRTLRGYYDGKLDGILLYKSLV
jgi:ribosomal-protein-alanine N-acetyltransferase